MMEITDRDAFVKQLRHWLRDASKLDPQTAIDQFTALTQAATWRLKLRRIPQIMAFSNQTLAQVYPAFSAHLLGVVPDSIAEDELGPELPLTKATVLLLRDLSRGIGSFDTCDRIKKVMAVVLESTKSPLPQPNMPFNDDDPYMEVND